MKLGNELLEVAFFGHRIPVESQIETIDALASDIAMRGLRTYHDLLNAATMVDIEPIEALLTGEDPKIYADDAWYKAQLLSKQVLDMNGALSTPLGEGANTEVAVHNILWYGIAHHGIGRYARLSTAAEDASGQYGKRDGFDIVFRTDRRKWCIQVKSSGNPTEIKNKFSDRVIVVSPSILLRQRDSTANDLHTAVATDDSSTLNLAWTNFLHELRTQKAPNGLRKVI